MRFFLYAVAIGFYFSSISNAQSTNPPYKMKASNHIMQWMLYDGQLEDEAKQYYAIAELETAKFELVGFLELLRQRQALRNLGSAAEHEFRSAVRDAAKAEAKVKRLEGQLEYFSIGTQLKEKLWRWEQGEQDDVMGIQALYWRRWEARCESILTLHAESVAEVDYYQWINDTNGNLAAGQSVSRQEIIYTQMALSQWTEKAKSLVNVRERCVNGPPFPWIESVIF